MRRDWLDTARRILRQLATLTRHMRPTRYARDVRAIDAEELCARGIRGVLWDVDGTLMSYKADAVAPELRAHVEALFRDERLHHAIVSNCDEARFLELGRIFPDAVVVRLYETDAGLVARTRRRGVDTYTPAERAAAVHRDTRAVRKPSRALIEAAAAALDDLPVARVVMVGDQHFTDIASASMAGAHSIKVATYRRDSFPMVIRVGQRIERVVARLRLGRHA